MRTGKKIVTNLINFILFCERNTFAVGAIKTGGEADFGSYQETVLRYKRCNKNCRENCESDSEKDQRNIINYKKNSHGYR